MSDMDTDLMRLHCMAVANTPDDATEAVEALEQYRKHREYCLTEYGSILTFHAEQYGHKPSVSEKLND